MIENFILLTCIGTTAVLAVIVAIAAYFISRTKD